MKEKILPFIIGLLVGAILCKKNGIDSSAIIDILSAAGIQ